MSQKLRDLIRRVRACKTAAEERAVIAKESALIRTAFKEQDKQYRHRNIAKLLFIHMLGYPSHFGQMECVKLIASPKFIEKRMGYLGLILLLSDQEEVLTLVTNSMKNDLNSSNPFVVSLSLTAIGNIASPDMARDLIMDIDRHLRSENQYLRKKAALASIRVFQKVPDVVEDFAESIQNLLKSKNHGVLLSGVQLIKEVVRLDPKQLKVFGGVVKPLVRILRNLLSMGYSSDYDVSGITDPFLQVTIIDLFCLLGKHNEEASEIMNDVLAQVATNTETAKTAGNAILYQCVQTIMAIQSDNGLKVLAVNILGRFLLNRDNNIRYVALNTLSKVITDDAGAVQRHTNTIVDCLKDPDASIRQRALELVYALVNESNIQTLAREMLNYLVVASNDQKMALCSRIADAVDRYAPSTQWHIDTLISMLSIAGAALPDDRISNNLILLIQRTTDLHAYVAHKLYWALHDDISQLSLVQVGIWCIGEYGNLMIGFSLKDEEASSKKAVEESQVIDLFYRILRHHTSTDVTRAYLLNACVKLTTRFENTEQLVRLQAIISTYSTSMLVELQQRSCEYTILGEQQWSSLRPSILTNMPPIDITKFRDRDARLSTVTSGIATTTNLLEDDSVLESTGSTSQKADKTAPNLLDFDDIFGGGQPVAPPSEPQESEKNSVSTSNTVDLLSDIFSLGPSQTSVAPALPPAPVIASVPVQSQATDLLGGLLDLEISSQESPSIVPVPVSSEATLPSGTVRGYDKNGIVLDLLPVKPNAEDPSITFIQAIFSNRNSIQIDQFVFLAAFPKYIKLKMEPPSGSVLPANTISAITQVVKIQNTMHAQKPVLMRIKLEYIANGKKVEDMAAIDKLPSN
uniref:AP-1 complex subunit gamma n=1 Tax=Albugo laibachii Nc14 TaxID=890382 RepID=F0W1Q3_9STRA|nr:clathrinadaptor gamma chain putative [Albugo laibachii Nc14]|eukprot:CCA14982.1 clathrinadaptor gamma chain putative [Albugo laibachii Nc14]